MLFRYCSHEKKKKSCRAVIDLGIQTGPPKTTARNRFDDPVLGRSVVLLKKEFAFNLSLLQNVKRAAMKRIQAGLGGETSNSAGGAPKLCSSVDVVTLNSLIASTDGAFSSKVGPNSA